MANGDAPDRQMGIARRPTEAMAIEIGPADGGQSIWRTELDERVAINTSGRRGAVERHGGRTVIDRLD
jgi:hypothetical protein